MPAAPCLQANRHHIQGSNGKPLNTKKIIFSPNWFLYKISILVHFASSASVPIKSAALGPLCFMHSSSLPSYFSGGGSCLSLPFVGRCELHGAKSSCSFRLQYCCSNNINGGETIHGQDSRVKLNFLLSSWHSNSKYESEMHRSAAAHAVSFYTWSDWGGFIQRYTWNAIKTNVMPFKRLKGKIKRISALQSSTCNRTFSV